MPRKFHDKNNYIWFDKERRDKCESIFKHDSAITGISAIIVTVLFVCIAVMYFLSTEKIIIFSSAIVSAIIFVSINSSENMINAKMQSFAFKFSDKIDRVEWKIEQIASKDKELVKRFEEERIKELEEDA